MGATTLEVAATRGGHVKVPLLYSSDAVSAERQQANESPNDGKGSAACRPKTKFCIEPYKARSVGSHEVLFAMQNNALKIFSVQKVRVLRLKFSSESVLWLILTRAAKKFLRGSCDSIPVMCWGFEWRRNYLDRVLMHLWGGYLSGTQQCGRALWLGLTRQALLFGRLASLMMDHIAPRCWVWVPQRFLLSSRHSCSSRPGIWLSLNSLISRDCLTG